MNHLIDSDKKVKTYIVDTLNIKDRFEVAEYTRKEALMTAAYLCIRKNMKHYGLIRKKQAVRAELCPMAQV